MFPTNTRDEIFLLRFSRVRFTLVKLVYTELFYACLLGEIIILPNVHVNGIAGWKISTGYPWRSHELVTSRMDARERVRVNTTWTDVDDDRNRWRITSRIILRDDVSKWFDHRDACNTSPVIPLSRKRRVFIKDFQMIFDFFLRIKKIIQTWFVFVPNLHSMAFTDVIYNYIPWDNQFDCIVMIWWL